VKALVGRSLLVVDSDATGLGRWRERLLGQGARVICSSSMDSALANAITFPAGTFHAVVIEHRPPRLDAFELTKVLRTVPSIRHLPVVVIAETADECMQVSAPVGRPSIVVRRPVSAEALASALIDAFAPISVPLRRSATSHARRANYRGTILVAEDDPVNAEIMRAMLASLGLEVELATNGAEAIAKSAGHRFDLVFMDAEMPLVDGMEATRRIRARESDGPSRQIIVCVTVNAADAYRARCMAAGMDDLVAKPVAIAALLNVLARWLPAPTLSGVRERVTANAMFDAGLAAAVGKTAGPVLIGPIDWSQVESLRTVDPGGNGGVVGKAIELYIDHAPRLIEQILTYRITGDLRDVKQAAHSLRSSSASLGAAAVADLSATIELAAARSDFEIIDSVATALEAEYRRAESALRSAVTGRTTVATAP